VINSFNRIRPIQFASLLAAVIGLVLFNLTCESPRAASGTHPASAESLHRIIESGELRVGMTGKQAPLNMKNIRGELTGLDVELARALANAMRVELVLVETPFSKLLSHLEKGKLDLVISSMTITPTRNARVAFAGPYMISGLSLLTRSDLVEQLSDVASLNSADRSWGALEGSTGEELIADVFPMARYVVIKDQQSAIEMIGRGELDGMVADHPSVQFAIARYPDLELASLPSPLTTEPLGIALPANSPLFANLVQNYVNTLDYTGQLMQMKARWLNGGDWLLEMP
jgi:ABC-type amino acid transport substrate-binding protein